MSDIFNAASAIMQPFATDSTSMSLNIAAVSFTAYTSDPGASLRQYVYIPNTGAVATSAAPPTATNPGYAAKVRWSISPSTISGTSGLLLTNGAALSRTCGSGVNPLLPSTTAPTLTDTTHLSTGLYGSTPLLIADIQYTYTPTFGATVFNFAGTWNWSGTGGMSTRNTTFMQPRNTWSTCSGGTDAWVCYPTRQTGTCASY